MLYILQNRQVVAAHPRYFDIWMKENDCLLFHDRIGRFTVKTWFTGVDQTPGAEQPTLFITVVSDERGIVSDDLRYATWEQAKIGHDFTVTYFHREQTVYSS